MSGIFIADYRDCLQQIEAVISEDREAGKLYQKICINFDAEVYGLNSNATPCLVYAWTNRQSFVSTPIENKKIQESVVNIGRDFIQKYPEDGFKMAHCKLAFKVDVISSSQLLPNPEDEEYGLRRLASYITNFFAGTVTRKYELPQIELQAEELGSFFESLS